MLGKFEIIIIWRDNYDNEKEIIKLLGYADLCQGSMLLECEMIWNGIDYHNSEYQKYSNQYIQAASDWILLFQIDSIYNSEFELIFGDNGRLYYYIREEDLKDKKFEKFQFIAKWY